MFAPDASRLHDPLNLVLHAQAGGLPLAAAANLQDQLMVAGNDLDRLLRLLNDANTALLLQFTQTRAHLQSGDTTQAAQTMADAITALQFQDLASQLITHVSKRLRHCADRIAPDTLADDEDGMAAVEAGPQRPNPITQDELVAGSVELF